MRQFAAVVLKLAEQVTLAVIAHGLLGQAEGNDLEVAELGDDATPGHISLVNSLNLWSIACILQEFLRNLRTSCAYGDFEFNVLIATKLLKISDMRNFLNIFLLTF